LRPVFGLLSLLTGQSTSAAVLLWMRFCTGLGVGGALPNPIAIVSLGICLVPFLLLVAWAACTFCDEPIRNDLRTRLRRAAAHH